MKEKNITISKTARYYTLGDISDNTNEVWFVFHGYGQLAQYFIKKFEAIKKTNNIIVAPEALNLFYWQGFTGRVAASWMTKEKREIEIIDNVNFLNTVFQDVIAGLQKNNVKVNVLAFSQGTATACRWIIKSKIKIDNLFLWADKFPHDIDYSENKDFINTFNSYFVIGDKDEFLSVNQIEKHKNEIEEKGIKTRLISFEGKHEIPEQELKKISTLV